VRFVRASGGIYLPEGYKPDRALDPWDNRPRSLTRVGDDATFVRVAGGTFRMGGPEGQGPGDPTQPVTLTGYYLQATEVTNGEFARFLDELGMPDLCPGWSRKFENLKTLLGGDRAQALRHPALQVPWKLAAAYAERRGGRLPSEAQWEFAARSRGGPYSRVWDYRRLKNRPVVALANLDSVGGNAWGTAPVGTYQDDATAQGVRDLAGNVREMCRDAWGLRDPSPRPLVDPEFPPESENQSVVLRGGSYLSVPESGLTTHREPFDPKSEASDVGFRIVIECPEVPARAR
jgi:serine/threonine-protein kinase